MEADRDRDKDRHFTERFKGKIKFAGPKHGRIKQIDSIINNTKSNPKNFFAGEGIWAIEKILQNKIVPEAFFFCPEFIHSPESEKLIEKCIEYFPDSYLTSKNVFLKISEKENPEGLLAIGIFPQKNLEDIYLKEKSTVIILDGIEIPGNIGTIIRSADGAGADCILVCNRRARLTHPKILKGSQGASLSMPIIEADFLSISRWLEENSFGIILTDTDAEKSFEEFKYPARTAIVAGSERYGITKEWYSLRHSSVSIPMLGTCDSLNVAVAASIILYRVALSHKL